MATLHIINSPPDSGALARCLYAATPGDTVLLIGNGVYCAAAAGFERHRSRGRELAWRTLAEDVLARSLTDRLASDVSLVDDGEFVDLVVAHHPIVSWSA